MEKQKNALVQPLPVLIGSTAHQLLNTFTQIKQDAVNHIPFEGSWTAAQLVEHVILSLSSGIGLLNGSTRKTDRAPDQYVQYLKDLFLNFDLKFPSAPNITPANKVYDKEQLIKEVRARFDELISFVQTKDLTDTCLLAEFYGIGPLTRLEWAYQSVYHIQRHIHQLKNIKARLEIN